MELTIASLDKTILHDKVKQVQLPGEAGQLGILKGHAPIISPLKKGQVRGKTEQGKDFKVEIPGGIAHVNGQSVKVLVR